MIRETVVAGTFYPQEKNVLKKEIKDFFKDVEKRKFQLVISPHAGYVYSGKTAAHAIGSLMTAKKFIVLGPNHNVMGSDFSIFLDGEWVTPLGNVNINSTLAKELLKCDIIKDDEIAHEYEHSIEVQLPLIQHIVEDFSFVPISIKNMDYSKDFLNKCEILGKHIANIIKDNNINVIASSDFSHYVPSDVADDKDGAAIEKIKSLDPDGFFEVLDKVNASVCGYGSIAVLMYVAKELKMKTVKVIDHSDSGDVSGDKSSVVAYYAIGFK
ncbi:MAG: AmmeMemoRadiSam system protein B [Candidatus Aenigmarchaeota archaeon]|nr:AmmeMemoRadiSam system protein B [Candidatus Aenigmarchaeota archaeon]